MSDSFDEQFKDLTDSIGNLSSIDSVKSNNDQNPSKLLNQFNEIEETNNKENINNNNADLINQIFTLIEENDFIKAEQLINEAQKNQIKNDKIYLALVMLEMRVNTLDLLGECLEFYDYAQNSNNYKRAYKFCDKELQDTLNSYVYNSYNKNVYLIAKRTLEEAKYESNIQILEEAAKMFNELGEYKDSKEQYAQCTSLLKDFENKEKIYNKLLDNSKGWKNASLETLLSTKKEITELNHYKESDNLLDNLTPILNRKQKFQEAKQNERKWIKRFLVFQIVWVITAFVIIYTIGILKAKGLFPYIPENNFTDTLFIFTILVTFLCFVGIFITSIYLLITWLIDIIRKK